jgi:HD-GYP domain-containing protein (c-di-GMP phosphodiesterase class II)
MNRKQHSLHRFVYRVLTRRIILATLVISAVLVAILLIREREQVSEAVVETARNRIEFLLVQTRELLKKPDLEPFQAFRQSLESLGAARLKLRMGSFVYAHFYDRKGDVIAESADEKYSNIEAIKALTEESPKRFPGLGESWHKVLRVNGRPYIHLVVPVTDLQGEVVAYAQGVFAVSDQAIADMRRGMVRTISWVIVIILVTSAILYPVIITLTRRLAKYSEDLLESHLTTVQILGSAIAKRDSDTSAHNFRVTIMSVRIAEALGLKTLEIQRLIKGAFLHDVGKIGISDNILLKPARLNEEEFNIIKTHVNHGIDIVTHTEWLKKQLDEIQSHVDEGVKLLTKVSWLDEATDVVGGHHEKFDGSGYPQGIKGEEITLVARIFAIADVFDALTCHRPYKEPFSFEKSMAILEEGRGSHFDPMVLDAFKSMADSIYREVAGREDEGLKEELEAITEKYFHAGLASLTY